MVVVVYFKKQFIVFFFMIKMICKYLYCVCMRVEEERVKELKNGRINNGLFMFQLQIDILMKFYNFFKYVFLVILVFFYEVFKIFFYVNNK